MKKKHIIHSAALLLGLCLAGCKESLPDNFGAIEGIYFYNQLTDRTVVDSAAYTFIYEDADVLEVPVRLQLVGRAAAQPRAVDVRVTSQDAEEGTDYTLGGEAVLPAGSVSFDYVVTLKRTDILKEKTKNLLLELRANENFIIPFTSQVQSGGDTVSAVTFKINFSDQFTAPPAGWRSLFVGPFSQQKFELICDVMEIPRADFNEVGKITNAKWLYIESRMINYVRDQEKLKAGGEPYDERAFDENGNPIPISTGGMSYGDEPMIELYAVTQEQYDAVMALIDSTTSFVDYDQNVLSIISDEAAGYFAGSKTVEEASKLIQSRVGLYMQEQK